MAKLLTLDQFQTSMNTFAQKCDDRFLKKGEGGNYTIKKQDTAESGFFATYQLFSVVEDGDDTAVGAKINIPKDFLVKSATIETVETPGSPYDGAKAGDKYIDFVVNTVDASETAQHIYLPVNDLVDVYTGGNGISIDANNEITLTVDSANANGLAVTANGLKLALATPDTYTDGAKTADGTAGALSSADKYKLDSLVEATDAEVAAVIAAIWAD